MGAKVWRRDESGQGHVFTTGVAAVPPPVQQAHLGKRKHVWVRGNAEAQHPAQSACQNGAAAQTGTGRLGSLGAGSSPGSGGAAGASCQPPGSTMQDAQQQLQPVPAEEQPDHFARRLQPAGNWHQPWQDCRPPSRGRGGPAAGRQAWRSSGSLGRQSSSEAAAAQRAREHAAAEEQQALREREMAALKRRIAEQQAENEAQKRARDEADARAARKEQELRRANLAAGFAEAFQQAKEAAGADTAKGKAVQPASAAEVLRVLRAKDDYARLQVRAGIDLTTLRRKYKDMAVSLHPDKCKVPEATDAFQLLVESFHNLRRIAGG